MKPLVLVTGAARRVGREIVLELARQGFDVALHCHRSGADAQRTQAQAIELGARCEVFQADLSDEASTRALLPAVVAAMGALTAVVNNASAFAYDAPESFSYALLQQQIAVNTAPAVLLAQALHRHCKQAGHAGCVVNLLDQKLWNPNPDYFSYTLSKAALHAANTMLAMALAPQLRVCGVAPGVTLLSGEMSPAEFDAAHRLTPLERSSTPQDVARAVLYLLQAPAVTGTTLLVDGGQHLSGQPRDVMFLARGEG